MSSPNVDRDRRPSSHGRAEDHDRRGVGDDILMLADGSGDFTRAVGLELDGRGFGLGVRSRRYAALVEDGVVSMLAVEPVRGVTVSSAEELLGQLRAAEA